MKSEIRTFCGIMALGVTLLAGGATVASVIANLFNPEMAGEEPIHVLVGSLLAAGCCVGVPWFLVMMIVGVLYLCVKE